MKDAWNAFIEEDIVLTPTGEGPLNGLTFSVKDVFAIKGYANTAGNPDWHRTHGPAEVTASSIEKLLGSGARMAGTTHTDELMYSLNGENMHYGTPVNPAAPDRIPGGSSSGSAVAVAAGLSEFALGTDTGGSVRVPSAYCGIFGFRPTHNYVLIDGVIPLAPSFDTVGWMARSTTTLLEVGKALLGGLDAESPSFSRLLFAEDAWAIAEPACREALERFARPLEQAAGHVEKVTISSEGLKEWHQAFRTAQGLDIWRTHGEWIEREKPVFEESIGERFAWASTLDEAESEPLLKLWSEVRTRLRELLGEDGLLVIPTIPGTAPERGISGEANELRRVHTMQLSCIAGLSGLPQLTIPAGTVDGAPIGLSIIAGAKQDLKLLHWVNGQIKKLHA